MNKNTIFKFVILFPGIGIFYFFLMAIDDIRIAGFELSSLRLFGRPTITNLIEIPIAASIGLIAAKTISAKEMSKKQRIHLILIMYAVITLMYFLFPRLPE